MQLVNQTRAQILPDSVHAAAETNIKTACRRPRLLQGRVNTFSHKVKLRPAGHSEFWSRMMGQNEDRRVIWRLVAPPALPALVRPRTAHRAKHISPENPRADIRKTQLGRFVVDACLAIRLAMHSAPEARAKNPVHQIQATRA